MKRFFTTLGLFSLFLLVSLAIVQFAINGFIRNKSIRTRDNLKQTENINADLVFLGSSRCTAHFDPVFFNNAYKLKSVNIGVDGHSELTMAITRLKAYLIKNRAPRYAILNFDPLVDAGDLTNNKNEVHKNDFARYAFFPDESGRLIADYFGYNFSERYIPAYAMLKYQLIGDCFVTRTSKYNINWYDKHLNPKGDYSDVTDGIKEIYPMPANIEGIKKNLAVLKELCIKNNIRLICIQTPVYKIAYDEKMFALPAQICSALNIDYLDVNQSSIKETKSYFYNANHMDVDGVNAMNEYLKANLSLQ